MTQEEIEALRRGDVLYRAVEVDGAVRVFEYRLDCPKLTDLQLRGGRGESGRLVSYGLPATVSIRRARHRGQPTERGSVERVSASDLARDFGRTPEEAARGFVEVKRREVVRLHAALDAARASCESADGWRVRWEAAKKVW